MARYALIIGITEYQNPHLSRLPKAATDAEIVAQVLEQYGEFQVKRVPEGWTGKQPKVGEKKVTGADLGQQLETLLLKQATGSEALIYFAGHGFTVSDNLGEQQGFLATSDCQIEQIGGAAVAQKYGISLESLNKLIAKSDLSSLVMLLDCCHSGYFLERNLIQQTLTAFSAQKDYYLITACRSYEKSKSFAGEPHSIFTGALLKGLSVENAASNRRVTGDRLFDFISTELKNSVQEPIRMGWGRSITLVTYPDKEPTPAEVTFNRENPYLGLRAFELEQQKYFFGRVQAVRALLARLTTNRFLAVIGPSGCGKSSLVKAGLLPQLQQDHLLDSSQWAIESFTPGKHPLGTLTTILERRHRENKPFVLFIDQFEEIFTLCNNPTERQSFIRLMSDEATTSERITRVIATIRGDFLDRCAEYPEAVSLINRAQPTTYVVTPLSRPELEEAIEKPATLHGVTFERGLVSQIIEDVENQAGALPLLQYALSELWRVFCLQDSPSSQPLLTWENYEQIGGVKGALDKRATLLYESLTLENQAFVRRLFMELVQVNEGQEVTRRRATWEELEAIADSPEQRQQVIELLADSQQRLIITDENTVDVAHEALLTEWKLLRDWIEENRESLRLRRRLEADCREWQERYEKSDDALLTGARLVVISEWVEKAQVKLPALEAEFLQKSLEKREQQLKAEIESIELQLEQERKLRELAEDRQHEAEARVKAESQRTKLAVIAGLLLGVLAISTSGLTLWVKAESNRATRNEIKALVESSKTLFNANKSLEALMASIKALHQLDINQSKVPNELQKVIYGVHEYNQLKSHTKPAISLSWHPEGNFIASSGEDSTIKIWERDGQLINSIKQHKDTVRNIKFSPNGKLLASGSWDGSLNIWDVDFSKKEWGYTTLIKNQGQVHDVTFSSKGEKFATLIEKTIMFWDVNQLEGIQPRTFRDKSNINPYNHVYSINFNLKGSILAAAFVDGGVRLWSLDKNEDDKPTILGNAKERHTTIARMVRFSPNPKQDDLLASASDDGKIKLWRIKSTNLTKLIATINAHDRPIAGIAFSPDGKVIASGSEDGTMKLWDVEKAIKGGESNLDTFRGHEKSVNRLEFSPNGKSLVSASDDGTVRLWQVTLHTELSSERKENPEIQLRYSCIFLNDYLEINKQLPEVNQVYSICKPYLSLNRDELIR